MVGAQSTHTLMVKLGPDFAPITFQPVGWSLVLKVGSFVVTWTPLMVS